jgi:molecular chaperone DnaJ
VNPGDRNAQERFDEVSEAFDVLSDPKKREMYDRLGFYSDKAGGQAGASGSVLDFSRFGAGNFSEVFSEVFGNIRDRAAYDRKEPARGSDIEFPVNVSFDDAMRGAVTTVDVDRNDHCEACQGRGEVAGSAIACPACKGSGQKASHLARPAPCSQCRGAGFLAQKCLDCKGSGLIHKRETITVRVPAGVETGSRIRVAGRGHAASQGGAAGDLYVVTNVSSHPYFKRQGDNIYCTVPITIPEAALGARIEVPTIDGKARLRIPPGTQGGQRFRLRERGAPSLRAGGRRGDQFVEVKITLPKIISEETKQLLQRYARYNPENPREEMGLK